MSETKTVDELLSQQGRKRAELAEIDRQMCESKRSAAIVFVDLHGSTELKEKEPDQEWLSSIYRFVEAVSDNIRGAGGTLVKRIGDGLLATFDQVPLAETFLDLIETSPALSNYTFKTAADFGEVYFFKFEPHLADDPYGPCVDRCARLLHLSTPGANLCGAAFVKGSKDKGRFSNAGDFALKGFSEPQQVFFRLRAPSAGINRFLEPLLRALNAHSAAKPSYRHVPRVFKPADFAALEGYARPFLLRELLNTPKLPMSYPGFLDYAESVNNEQELQEYCGWLVEWEAPFGNYNRLHAGDIQAFFHPEDHRSPSIMAELPPFMLDAVRALRKGQKARLRGIISRITPLMVDLNYVDIDLCSQQRDQPNSTSGPTPHDLPR